MSGCADGEIGVLLRYAAEPDSQHAALAIRQVTIANLRACFGSSRHLAAQLCVALFPEHAAEVVAALERPVPGCGPCR